MPRTKTTDETRVPKYPKLKAPAPESKEATNCDTLPQEGVTFTITPEEYRRLQRIAEMYGYGDSADAVAALLHELIEDHT